MRLRLIRHVFALALAVICAVFVVACGDSNDSDSSKSTADTASPSSLGQPKAAHGTPIEFGAINYELASDASFPQEREGALAAAQYVNNYLGGIGGRPIKINTCLSDGSGAKSSACANKIVKAKPTAVLGMTDLGGAQTLPIYAQAKLAMFGGLNLTPAESTAPNSLVFNDLAAAGNADNGSYAVQELHAKKVAIIVIGVPQGEATINHYTVPAIKGTGGESKLFRLPPTQADATSVVSSALAYKPDAIVINSPSQCVAILQALKSLGNGAPIVAIEPCASPPVVKSAGDAAEGVYYFGAYRPVTGDEQEAKITSAAMKKYSPKTPVDSVAVNGFSTVMNLYNAFKDSDVDSLTSDKMLEQLKSAGTQKSWLAADYNCNGKALAVFPSLCSTGEYLYQIKDGKPALLQQEPYDGGAKYIPETPAK